MVVYLVVYHDFGGPNWKILKIFRELESAQNYLITQKPWECVILQYIVEEG